MRLVFLLLHFDITFFILKNAMSKCNKNRLRSVPSSLHLAGNTTLYYLSICNVLPSVRELVGSGENSETVLFPGVRLVIQLVLMNHMRISECLDICVQDEIKPSIFLVRAKKKGHNYSIHIPIDYRNRKVLNSLHPGAFLFPFSYHFVWRSMVKAGMSIRVSTRVNRIVTHRGRFDLAGKLIHLNQRENITPLLHHKSKKSKEFYIFSGTE